MCKIVLFPSDRLRPKLPRKTHAKGRDLSFLDYVQIVAALYDAGRISKEVAHYMIESYLDLFHPMGEK
jgi:hypothetical protein